MAFDWAWKTLPKLLWFSVQHKDEFQPQKRREIFSVTKNPAYTIYILERQRKDCG